MIEKIYVANGVSETELLRTLAKNGVNTFGVRVKSPFDLAKYALECSGISMHEDFLASSNEAAIVFNDGVLATDYFKNLHYEDAKTLFLALDELRLFITSNSTKDEGNELKKLISADSEEEFIEELKKNPKNRDLLTIYSKYMNKLSELNLIDSISIIRRAISETTNSCFELYILDEFPLKPLEMRLVEVLSNNKFKRILLSKNQEISIAKYTKAYGIRNEIENVLNTIIENNIPFDQCSIVCAETVLYTQIITDYCELMDIPYTSSIGENFAETNTGRLYRSIIDWQTNFKGRDGFLKIVNDASFDKSKLLEVIGINDDDFLDADLWKFDKPSKQVFQAVGDLRIDLEKNLENVSKVEQCIAKLKEESAKEELIRLYESAHKLVEELNKGIVYFIKTYKKDNPFKNENSLVASLDTLYSLKNEFNIKSKDIEDVAVKITTGGSQSAQNKLHITTLNKAIVSIRPYVFIAGLSSNNFPGSPKENAMILDADYKKFIDYNKSEKEIEDAKERFNSLLYLCNEFGAKVHLSYSEYNEASLKSQNSSSILFECFKNECKDVSIEDMNSRFNGKVKDERFEKVSFFDKPFSKNVKLGNEFKNRINYKNDGESIVTAKIFKANLVDEIDEENEEIEEKELSPMPSLYKKRYSASTIVDFSKCPRMFYYKDILRLECKMDRNELELIPGNDFGTLVHGVLETFDKKKESKEDLIQRGLNALNRYLLFHIPVSDGLISYTEESVKTVLSNAYDILGTEKTALAEVDIYKPYKDTGIIVHGLPDKVIKLDNGNYKVIDYKIKNKIEHNPKKLETCAQIVLYSYLFEQYTKKTVESGAFYYLKQGKAIEVPVKEGIVDLDVIIENMKRSFDTGDFPACPSRDACKYCSFKNLCGGNK